MSSPTGLPGAGLQERLSLLCLVSCPLRFLGHLQPPQILPLPRTLLSPPSRSRHSTRLLNPKASDSALSPQMKLRSQGFPSQLLSTPDRWSLGTGYPRTQKEGSLSRMKPEDALTSGRGQPFRAAIHRRERGDLGSAQVQAEHSLREAGLECGSS